MHSTPYPCDNRIACTYSEVRWSSRISRSWWPDSHMDRWFFSDFFSDLWASLTSWASQGGVKKQTFLLLRMQNKMIPSHHRRWRECFLSNDMDWGYPSEQNLEEVPVYNRALRLLAIRYSEYQFHLHERYWGKSMREWWSRGERIFSYKKKWRYISRETPYMHDTGRVIGVVHSREIQG